MRTASQSFPIGPFITPVAISVHFSSALRNFRNSDPRASHWVKDYSNLIEVNHTHLYTALLKLTLRKPMVLFDHS